MFKKWMRYVLMDQAGEGGAASGGAAATGAEVDGAAATSGAAPATDGGAATVLQTAAGAEKGVPEKFQVKKEDGTLDYEATLAKLTESYSAAEKRIGSGDVPPKAVGDYKITVPEALKDAWNPGEDTQLAGFLEKAHAAGYTQKQIDLAIEQYGQIAPGLVQGAMALDADACIAELKTEWKTDADYEKNASMAVAGLRAYAGDDAQDLMSRYGNDPKFIRMLAKIGAETGEDGSTPATNLPSQESIQELLASEAYRNPGDPQHAAVSAKVKAYYDAKAAQDAKTGNVPLM